MRLLGVFPVVVQAMLLGSVGFGLSFLLLTAFGALPSPGGVLASMLFAPFWPIQALAPAISATLVSGIAATVIATLFSLALIAAIDPGPAQRAAVLPLWSAGRASCWLCRMLPWRWASPSS